MRQQLRFTGIGGQGVILAGEIMASAKINVGGHAMKTATYTSQVRGGPTVVDVALDEGRILYPYASDGEVDFMLSVAQSSYNIYKTGVRDGATIVVDPNLVKVSDEDRKRWHIVEVPIITIAKHEVGNVITQSVVALGVASVYVSSIARQTLIDTMLSKVPKKVHEANLKAFELGEKYAKEAA